MKTPNWRGLKLVCLAASTALVVAACGGSDIRSSDAGAGGATCDDTLNMAVNPWVGYEADAYVVGRVAETQLGCQVVLSKPERAGFVGGIRQRRRRRRDGELGP